MTASPTSNRSSRGKRIAIALTLVALIGLLAASQGREWLRAALEQTERLGPWGAVLYIATYVVATVLLLPGSALALAAGALFGVARGTLYASTAATLGATAAFLIGRYLARDWVTAQLARHPKIAALDEAVAKEGWRIVLLTRLSPAFPFTLLNYAFGLTRVRLRDYVLASWVGMMPGALMYVYLGSLARAGVEGQKRSPAQMALYGVGLLATIAVTVRITRMARQSLAKRTSSPS